MRHIIKFFATGCYSGLLPACPGTWGTAAGAMLFWLVKDLPQPAYAAFVVAFIAFAVWVSNYALGLFGEPDPQPVVIDEIAGFLVTMAFHGNGWPVIIAGFLLFRVFDIVKPWPANWAEKKFSDGRGIVFDDIFAGVYANAALWVFEYLWPKIGTHLSF